MKFSDKLYGTFEVNDRVLIELISSKPLQRLKKVNQAGASKYILSWKTVTRFDHCLGVMLLLRKFKASLAEQIAGLLHDISHTAFSHVIDFVFPSENHEFHEKHFRRLILASEIPKILKEHDYSLNKILDIESFTLLENKIPDICADRIDYFLRDEESQFGKNQMIKNSLAHLITKNSEFHLDDPQAALEFARAYLKRNESSWSDPREIALYQVLAKAIRKALENGFLIESDLFTDDELILGKLKKAEDSFIKRQLKLINPNFSIHLNKNKYDFFIKNKLRFIDPKIILKNGEVKRVSDIYPQFKDELEKHKKKMRQGFYIKINK